MRKFQLSVHQYRQALEKQFGYADPEMVKRYAVDKQKHKAAQLKDPDFNPFTSDPNCKSCRKKKDELKRKN